MKNNMKDVAYNGEKDRQFLMTEIERQNEVLDQLSGTRIIGWLVFSYLMATPVFFLQIW
jgi:hypothetical protein